MVSILLPILGAFLEAAGAVLDKRIIHRLKVNYKAYTIYIFAAIILASLPLLFFFWNLKPEALLIKNLSIFFLIVIFSVFANLLTFYSITREDLSEVEPVRLTLPLFTVLLAFIFSFFFEIYKDERNYAIIFLGLIASIALVFAHIRKNRLYFNKYLIAALVGSFLYAFELTLSKSILFFYNPLTFYFLRSLWIFLIVWMFFYNKLTPLKIKTKLLILIVGVIAVMYRVILYYGYQTLGVVFTTTLFILAPVLIYIFAAVFLKEKITKRQIASSIVIVICVIVAILVGG